MNKIIKGFVLLCFLISVENANARCNPLKPSTCVSNKYKNEITKSRISIRNKCYEKIYVGVQYHNGKKWLQQGWYPLSPNETSYIVDSMATTVYFTAHSQNGNRKWGNNSHSFNVRGSVYPAFKANVGQRGMAYTQDFSCS